MIEMRFDEMDKKMRVYEQSLDQVLLALMAETRRRHVDRRVWKRRI